MAVLESVRTALASPLVAALLVRDLSPAGNYPDEFGRSENFTRITTPASDLAQGVVQPPEAQHNLGSMYAHGQGVPEDDGEAVKWFLNAAVRGCAFAQVSLGAMYASGQGVPQDYTEAVNSYEMAAEQGYDIAQRNLGIMYANGAGVPQDYVQAHKWFNLAAARGGKDSVDARDRVASIMTREQIAEAQRLASEWMEQHPQ